jgi:metallo-beta-lactamase class B
MNTNKTKLAAVVAAAAALLAACATPSPPASQATVDAKVKEATALAGEDLKFLLPVCNPQPAQRAAGPAVEDGIRRLIAQPPPEPGQAMDNLWFVGSAWVSAWVLRTSEGLVLIDALNNGMEAEGLIEGGMRKLGLDPAQIKYLVVTHGHGDHYGGAIPLVQKYRMRVVASEIDWQMMETRLEFDTPVWGRPPKRDIAVKDGDKLTLGDTTITFYVTPGHTLGTLSPVFDVKAGGRSHKALIWGGTSFNFGRDMGRLDGYMAAAERMRSVAAQSGVDVMLSNHPGFDGTVAKLQAYRARPASNPFVTGTPVVDRSLRIMGTCARAQKDRFLIS